MFDVYCYDRASASASASASVPVVERPGYFPVTSLSSPGLEKFYTPRHHIQPPARPATIPASVHRAQTTRHIDQIYRYTGQVTVISLSLYVI